MWAKFDCNGAEAKAEKDLSLPGDYWAEADIQIPADTLTACSDSDLFGGSAELLALLRVSDHHETAGMLIIDNSYPDGDWSWYTSNGVANNDTGVAFAADTTYNLKAHWDGTHVEWYLDGTLIATNTVAAGAPTAGIIVGGYGAEDCECEWYFVTNVKVGTSDGGTDIFADDFSGGDFSNWDSTTGSCSVVSAPSGCSTTPPIGDRDTLDTSIERDLATWDPVRTETSMVKFSDGSFWIAETDSDRLLSVRKVASDGTQTVYPVYDQISEFFPYFYTDGVFDAILGTDGTDVWVAFLSFDKQHFVDQPCDDHPIPDDRLLPAHGLGVASFAESAPSGAWVDNGPAFYIFGKDVAATNNDIQEIGQLPPLLPTEDDPLLSIPPISVLGCFTACASSAEEGVFHVMWSEAGYAGNFNPCDHDIEVPSGDYISRLSYSRWTPSALDTQVDLLSNTENWGDLQVSQGGAPLIADAVAFVNAVMRNDTGSAVAFVNQIASYASSSLVETSTQFIGESEIRMWDLSSPTAGSPDELQNSSGVVPSDLSYILMSNNPATSDGFIYMGPPLNSVMLHCAPAYADPLLSDENVYLVGVHYIPTVDTFARTFVLRVPCDGSAAFDFLDGDETAGTGLIRDVIDGGDFVSEPRNVWWPSLVLSGTAAKTMQYARSCTPGWLRDPESVGETSVACPRGIDLDGDVLSFVSGRVDIAQTTLTQQLILRDAIFCGGAGLHVWQWT